MTNISEYPTSKSMVMSVQPFQKSNIYQSNINNGVPGNYINTGLNQSTKLLNKGQTVNIYDQPINIYQPGKLKTKYTPHNLLPIKILPTKYLPVKVITDNKPLIIINSTQSFPSSNYKTQGNNINIIANNNMIKQTNTYYNNTSTTTTSVSNISYINKGYNTKNYQTHDISKGYINSVASTSHSNYTAQINGYQTHKKTENINNEGKQRRNEEYFIDSSNSYNSFNSDDSQYAPQENMAHSYILNSPLIKKKVDIFSEISSQMSNFETQSYNQENTIYRLQNEILNLKAENETFKKKLAELDKYKSEIAESNTIKEQQEQLSSLKNQIAEMASLKVELDEIKKKFKEL